MSGTDRTPAQTWALAIGVVYLLVGIVGFAVTGFGNFFGHTYGNDLLIFSLNPAHNIVHLLLGAVWIWASRTYDTAKTVNTVFGVVLLVVFVLGLLGVLKFLAIKDAGDPDNYLHLLTGAASVFFGTAGALGRRTATAT
jgi:F0F1-type ATP synthase membrane subunit a